VSGDIDEVKQKLPMPALLHQLGLGDRAKKSARCPLPGHKDNEPSFGIFKTRTGAWQFKCFSCNSGGDEIEFLRQYENLANGAAIKRYLDLAGANGSRLKPRMFREVKAVMQRGDAIRPQQAFDWQARVDAFTPEHQEGLCEWRGFSPAFVSWLRAEKLIGLHEGCIAFPVHEGGHIVGCHYRPKHGEKWFYYPNGINAAPLIFGEITQGDPLHGFESTWDTLIFMDRSGERSGIICTRGASNPKFIIEAAARSKPSVIYLWTQNDEPGEKWQADIVAGAECTVKRCKVPAPHKDLNDWTRAGATVDELLAAMLNVEVLREAEKSWTEALNESVVTSRELRDLALTPRKKLLGDWFCEGDCGFIFAFRGVGKTWLALAIAQALSTAGKLGEWQASERARVLYVDGEMPPDLMRDRAQGLEKGNDELEFLNHLILFERTGRVLNIANREVQQALAAHCIANAVKVLILDNLSTLASGMKENEADSWELLNAWLLDLRRRKIAVVIVHHAGRSGEMRGTSKREDNVFWIIALDDAKKNAEDKRGARFVSRFTKPSRNTQEDVPAFEWHFVTEPNGDVSISHKLAQTMDVFLGLVGDGVNECTAISEEMKISKPSVSRMAKQAETAGKIIIKSRRYFLEEGAKNEPKL
jgi:AAA domain-containing protein/CHC2-type zinc finger protein